MTDCGFFCKFIFLRIRSKKWNLNRYLFHLTSTLSLYCLVLVLLNGNKERTTIYFPFLLEKLLWIIHFPLNNSRRKVLKGCSLSVWSMRGFQLNVFRLSRLLHCELMISDEIFIGLSCRLSSKYLYRSTSMFLNVLLIIWW